MDVNPPLSAFLSDYTRHLRGQMKSPKTVLAYTGAIRKLIETVGDLPVRDVRKEHLDEFIARIRDNRRYSTASLNNYVRSLRPYFAWLVEEGEIDRDPMARIHTPKLDEKVVPVPADASLKLLLECIGERRTDFAARRDVAIIRLFMATGARRAELAAMTVDDIDLEAGVVRLFGKGRRERLVGISGEKALSAVSRYLRVRAAHKAAHLPALWLGEKGALTGMGIYMMLIRRAKQAGIVIHPHQFRHWYAHQFLSEGGQEGDLQRSAGWASRQMVSRYAASSGSARAMAASRRLAVSDRV